MVRIHLDGLSDNATVPSTLAVLRGRVSPVLCTCPTWVTVSNGRRPGVVEGQWPVRRGRFVAFVRLLPGTNVITLQGGTSGGSLCLRLVHRSPQDRLVLPVYVVCRDDDGRFQAPAEVDNSVDSALLRLRLGAQLLQAFVSESLHAEGFGRRTFRLSEDDSCCPLLFRWSLSRAEAQAMPPDQVWKRLALDLVTSSDLPVQDAAHCKFLAVASFTEYRNPEGLPTPTHQDVLRFTKGHVALGGGGLALIGSGCLHTWSPSLDLLVDHFTNSSRIDPHLFMDDSAGRGTHWACYSTCLGAACHELGHTFDLGHTPHGIMGRGFDDIHRFFILDELTDSGRSTDSSCRIHRLSTQSNQLSPSTPQNLIRTIFDGGPRADFLPSLAVCTHSCSEGLPLALPAPKPLHDKDKRDPFWHRSSALLLAYHQWLNAHTPTTSNGPVLEGLSLSSEHPVHVIEVRDSSGCTQRFWEFPTGTQSFVVELEGLVGSVTIIAEDIQGNLMKVTRDCT